MQAACGSHSIRCQQKRAGSECIVQYSPVINKNIMCVWGGYHSHKESAPNYQIWQSKGAVTKIRWARHMTVGRAGRGSQTNETEQRLTEQGIILSSGQSSGAAALCWAHRQDVQASTDLRLKRCLVLELDVCLVQEWISACDWLLLTKGCSKIKLLVFQFCKTTGKLVSDQLQVIPPHPLPCHLHLHGITISDHAEFTVICRPQLTPSIKKSQI